MKRTLSKIAGVFGVSVLAAQNASAALSTEVTTAITNSQADVVEAGGLIIAMAAVAMGLRWVKATFF